MSSEQPLPPEKQPWWLPNPKQCWHGEGRPGLGWIVGNLAVVLLLWPPLMVSALIIGPGKHGSWNVDIPPEMATALKLDPIGTYAIIGVTGLLSLACGWLLLRGRSRPDLWRAIFGFWLMTPGQTIAFDLLHWFRLWYADVGIYDVGLRLEEIGQVTLLPIALTTYLLCSRRMKARFPQTAIDVAAVF